VFKIHDVCDLKRLRFVQRLRLLHAIATGKTGQTFKLSRKRVREGHEFSRAVQAPFEILALASEVSLVSGRRVSSTARYFYPRLKSCRENICEGYANAARADFALFSEAGG